MRTEETMTDDFQNVLRRVIAAQPKIYLSGHEGYYRHADIARLLQALPAWNTRPSVDRDAVIACIRDASDRAFEAGRKGDAHFRFGDIIAHADALLSASTVEG